MLFDLVEGSELQEVNKNLKLCPASTWKLLTTAAAAEKINRENPFKTQLIVQGDIQNGVLKGNVIIKGFGDPTFGSEVFFKDRMSILNEWAKALKAEGIEKVEGKILGDGSWLQGMSLPRTRIWEDMANYYGTQVSGLNFHDNLFTLDFNTKYAPGEQVKLLRQYPEVPGLEIKNEVLASTIRYDRAFIFGSPLCNNRVVRGTLPAGYDHYEIEGSIPNSAFFCAFHFKNILNNLGISVEGVGEIQNTKYDNGRVLKTENSPDLNGIVREILQNSNNFYAEALTAKLGEENGVGNLETGVKKIIDFYEKHCDSSTKIHGYDGSGLSRFNALSSSQFQHLIIYCNSKQYLKETILNNLPRFGLEGTVKQMGKNTPLEGNVLAKSGSMEGVLAYCGIFTALSGRQMGFAILINNYESPSYQIRNEIEKLLLKLYEMY